MLVKSVTSTALSSSMLGRAGFFGERCSQLRGAVPVVVGDADTACPSACCCASVGDVIVDDGDKGPMFVTNSAPNFGAGIGDPGAFGTSSRSLPMNPGRVGVGLFGRSGASEASRECVSVAAAKGSSPRRSDVALARASRCDDGDGAPRCEVGEPMTSSTMRLRSTALATRSGSIRVLFSLGGGHTASRKIEPDSERMPSR